MPNTVPLSSLRSSIASTADRAERRTRDAPCSFPAMAPPVNCEADVDRLARCRLGRNALRMPAKAGQTAHMKNSFPSKRGINPGVARAVAVRETDIRRRTRLREWDVSFCPEHTHRLSPMPEL